MANPFFDAAYYLAKNPDVAAAGYTPATAENHYLKYGAALAHYLSYGLHESRGGVDAGAPGSFFTPAAAGPPALPPVVPPVTPGQAIVVDPSGTYVGTSGDDIFTANGASLNHSILDGLAGNDSLQLTMGGAPDTTTVALTSIENIAVTLTGANTLIDTGGTGVGSLTVGGARGAYFAYEGDKIASLTLAPNLGVHAAFTPDTVAGTDDSLHIDVIGGMQGAIVTSHIEIFDIVFGTDTGASVLSLGVGVTDSNIASVLLGGGQAGEAVSLIFANDLALAPQTISINGAAVAGDLMISLDGMASASAILIGGTGDDRLTAVSEASQNSTLDGGAGNDTLTASAGIDTMTGGAGNDIFAFAAGPDALARILGPDIETDRIADFSDGDQLGFTGLAATIDPLIATAIESVERGVVTFKAGFLSGIADGLAGIVAAIDADMMLAGAGEGSNLLCNDGAASYFLHTGVDLLTSGLVKLELAGVAADITQLTADALGAHYTAAPV